jgi:ribosome biogenesis GTPase A
MAKATREIENLKSIDGIIQVVDARAIAASSNDEISKLNKPTLTVALKSDLSDVKHSNTDNFIMGTIKDKSLKFTILNKMTDLFGAKINSLKSKGLLKPTFHLIVIGLPNVGKSSLINYLAGSKKVVVENRAGVTRRNKIIKINELFYLYDTPGIMFKKVSDDKQGYILSLLNVIKQSVIPFFEVNNFVYDYLNLYYYEKFNKFFHYDGLNEYVAFRQFVMDKHFLKTSNEADYYIYKTIISDDFIKLNYEKQ